MVSLETYVAQADNTMVSLRDGHVLPTVTPPPAAAPNAPTGLTATATGTTTGTLTWTAATLPNGATAVTGYKVYNGAGSLLQTLGVVTSTTITGLNPAATYSFYVTAVNSAGESSPTLTKSFTTQSTIVVGGTLKNVWGAAIGGNASPANIESLAGRPIGVRRTYQADVVSALVNQATTDIAAQRVPWVSAHAPQPAGTSTPMAAWASVAAGNQDAWCKSLANGLGALNGPVILSVNHEPENDDKVTAGGTSAADMANWVSMQNRIYSFTRLKPNIRFGPILMGYGSIFGNARFKLDALWPGEYLSGDFIAFDPYNYYGAYDNAAHFQAGGTTGRITTYKDTAATYCTPLDNFAKAKGIMWALAENGQTHDGADKDIVDHGTITQFRNIYNFGKTTGRMLAYSYFDSVLNSRGQWDLETHTNPVKTKMSAFIDILKISPDWQATW